MRTVEVSGELEIDPLDDEWRALEWLIAHSPQDGFEFRPGKYVYVQLSSLPVMGKTIWIIYTFNAESVNIIAAKFVTEQDEYSVF